MCVAAGSSAPREFQLTSPRPLEFPDAPGPESEWERRDGQCVRSPETRREGPGCGAQGYWRSPFRRTGRRREHAWRPRRPSVERRHRGPDYGRRLPASQRTFRPRTREWRRAEADTSPAGFWRCRSRGPRSGRRTARATDELSRALREELVGGAEIHLIVLAGFFSGRHHLGFEYAWQRHIVTLVVSAQKLCYAIDPRTRGARACAHRPG